MGPVGMPIRPCLENPIIEIEIEIRPPSTRALASRLRVARASVVSAYEQLLAEGYLAGKVGSGTYISSDLPEPLERRAVPRTPITARRPHVPPPATRLERLAQATGESETRPFAMGRCRGDARTSRPGAGSASAPCAR